MTCNSNIAQKFQINIDGKYKEFKRFVAVKYKLIWMYFLNAADKIALKQYQVLHRNLFHTKICFVSWFDSITNKSKKFWTPCIK